MSDGISTQGTKIEMSANVSPASYSEIPECKQIPGPEETSDEIEMTHLRSTGGRREFIQSFKDTGDLALECNYIPGNAVQASLRDAYDAGVTLIFRITYPDNATAVFNGYVKGRGSSIAVAAGLPFNVVVRVTGAVDYTEAP